MFRRPTLGIALAVSIVFSWCSLSGAAEGDAPKPKGKKAVAAATKPAPAATTPAKGAPVKGDSTVTPNSRGDKWWMPRHTAAVARVKKGNVNLLFIGDSITQGWEGSGKKTWDQFYGKRNAVNLGFSGDRTQHVLWRLEHGEIDGIKPKLAVIMIGTNNSAQNSSEQIANGVTAIVHLLHERLPQTKILLLGIFPRGADDKDAKRKVNEGANAIISKLADDKTVFYMDIGPKFLGKDGKTLPKEIMPDLLHPKDKGYAIWAEAIEPKVKSLMGE